VAKPIRLSLLFVLLLTGPAAARDDKEALWEAARKGDAAAVRTLLDKGVDVNAKTSYGATALSFAADKGHLEVVRLLLKHKADVNAKDTFYTATPFTWAQMRGHWDIVETLIDAGVDGSSVLRNAIAAGEAGTVRAILRQGKVKPEALTSALSATPANDTEIRELLWRAGAKSPARAKAPAKPASLPDAATLQSYVGTYDQPESGELNVALKDGKPGLLFGGKTFVELVPVDRTTFKMLGNDAATFTFQRDGDRVVALVMKAGANPVTFKRTEPKKAAEAPKVADDDKPVTVAAPANWPQFRGPSATGVADGQQPPVTWDVAAGRNVRWKTPIPGLGHSCPVVWGDRVYLTTAISGDAKADLRVGQYGDVDSVNDNTVHRWLVYALDKRTGKIVWERQAHEGVPKVKRHMKSTHANPTPATDGRHVIACFGSEGLYCYDCDGNLLWKRDLGQLNASWFYDPEYQWGFGSSPILYRNLVIVQCDIGKGSFLAAYNVADGKPVWQTPREEIPSWGTPTVVEGKDRAELVTNATKFVRGYDPLTGKELWRLGKNAEITAPTPFAAQDLIFVTSGYRPIQPIYAIRTGASGDITLKDGAETNEHIAWSKRRGGPYMPTPIAYGDYFYTCANNGLLTCYEIKTGKQVYQQRLGGRGGYTASPVAADGRLYFVSEEGEAQVVKAGPKYELLAKNKMDDVCMATPAIADGLLLVRTQRFLYALGRPEAPRTDAGQ
jgi:outer membrane protein assembly factor BamB